MKKMMWVCIGLSLVLKGAGMEVRWVDLPKPDRGGVPENDLYDYGVMGPPATPEIVNVALAAIKLPIADGPVKPTWESLQENYRSPEWFEDAKFGIFMHWGLYSVPAHRSEWYEKHLYNAFWDWHSNHFGAPAEFGYKDFIPLFTAKKWQPDNRTTGPSCSRIQGLSSLCPVPSITTTLHCGTAM